MTYNKIFSSRNYFFFSFTKFTLKILFKKIKSNTTLSSTYWYLQLSYDKSNRCLQQVPPSHVYPVSHADAAAIEIFCRPLFYLAGYSLEVCAL